MAQREVIVEGSGLVTYLSKARLWNNYEGSRRNSEPRDTRFGLGYLTLS